MAGQHIRDDSAEYTIESPTASQRRHYEYAAQYLSLTSIEYTCSSYGTTYTPDESGEHADQI